MRKLAVMLLITSFCVGCGSSYTPSPSKKRDARPLASVYDFIVSVPDLSFPLLSSMGLEVDMTLEIAPDGLEPSGTFVCKITINQVLVGGVSRPFTAASPLMATGLAIDSDFAVDSFGPIMVGTAASGFSNVMLSLVGVLESSGRTIDGMAVVTSSSELGTFHAVKQRRYLVAGTAFGVTGTVSLVRVRFDTIFDVDPDLETTSGDPVVRATGNGVYVVNRFFFDNIQSLDPPSGFSTALQFSTGNGSNPHDALEIDPDQLYVTRYEPPFNDVLIADRNSGDSMGFIDLSSLATNSSGTPRPDGLALADGLVFVGLQNIDISFLEYGTGLVAVIDPSTGSLVKTIGLVGRNPFGPPAVHPVTGDLYYAMAGVFEGTLSRELSGGIEVIDPRTMTTQGLLIDDNDLGGNVSSVALVRAGSGTVGYVVVTDSSGVNSLRTFNPETGAIAPGSIYRSNAFLPEVISDGDGYVLIPENDINNPRLVVLEAVTGQVIARLRFSLPPFSVTVLTRDLPRN